MIGVLLIEAMETLRVCLNMYFVCLCLTANFANKNVYAWRRDFNLTGEQMALDTAREIKS